MRVLPLLILSMMLGGCVTLPKFGGGSLTELQPSERYSVLGNKPLDPSDGLRFELELVRRHLDLLVLEGAGDCMPAVVHTVRLQEVRIARELSGGLVSDAMNNLIFQRKDLLQLEQHLDYLLAGNVCKPTAKAMSVVGQAGSKS